MKKVLFILIICSMFLFGCSKVDDIKNGLDIEDNILQPMEAYAIAKQTCGDETVNSHYYDVNSETYRFSMPNNAEGCESECWVYSQTRTAEIYLDCPAGGGGVNLEQPLSIITWNLQIFGPTKASKDDVVQTIVDTIDGYDLITLQEIRDADQTAHLVITDKMPDNYDFILSDRTGRSTSKEAYLVIYNTDKIQFLSHFLVDDVGDHLERDLHEFNFRINGKEMQLISTHIKPDDAEQEIDTLMTYYNSFVTDAIFAGDLNADCDYFNPDEYDTYGWIPTNVEDTTVGQTDCAYDRIITTEPILDYGIIDTIESEVSDHYPVWAIIDAR